MTNEDSNVNNQINDLKYIISSLNNLKETIESLGSHKTPEMTNELSITINKLSIYKKNLKNIYNPSVE